MDLGELIFIAAASFVVVAVLTIAEALLIRRYRRAKRRQADDLRRHVETMLHRPHRQLYEPHRPANN